MSWGLTKRPKANITLFMETRLKTNLWVDALVRTNFGADMPTFVVAKGDGERGGVLLKINLFASGVKLFEQSLDFEGRKIWRSIGFFEQSAEREADAAVAQRRGYDPDLWVLEIEDRDGAFELDAPVSDF